MYYLLSDSKQTFPSGLPVNNCNFLMSLTGTRTLDHVLNVILRWCYLGRWNICFISCPCPCCCGVAVSNWGTFIFVGVFYWQLLFKYLWLIYCKEGSPQLDLSHYNYLLCSSESNVSGTCSDSYRMVRWSCYSFWYYAVTQIQQVNFKVRYHSLSSKSRQCS